MAPLRGLDVAIVGAGMGGLSAGIALRRMGASVTVFERAPELVAVGAGVCMWPNGALALRALDASRHIEDVSPEVRTVRYLSNEGEALCDVAIAPAVEAVGQRPYPLARSDLQMALLTSLGEDCLVLNTECVDVRTDGERPVVAFADGSNVAADLVIGADGIRSRVRERCLGVVPLRYAYCTWVGFVEDDPDLTPPGVFSFIVGESKRVGLLAVGAGRLYYFLDAPLRADEIDDRDPLHRLRELFAGWPSQVGRLLDRIKPGSIQQTPVSDLAPLESFVNGRVVLLGDAAHATTPTLGQGGALAMEDSLVLAHYLGELGIEAGLAAYDAERTARTRIVVEAARRRTETMMGVDLDETDRYYRGLRVGESDRFVDQLIAAASSAPDVITL